MSAAPTTDGWHYRLVDRPFRTRAGSHVQLMLVRFEGGNPVEAQSILFGAFGEEDRPIQTVAASLRLAAKALRGTRIIPFSEVCSGEDEVHA